MQRPPRDPRQRLFTRRLILRSLLQGIGAFASAGLVFAASVRAGMGELDVRTLSFSALIVANLALIAANRSLTRPFWAAGDPNPMLRWLAIGALTLLAAILYTPLFRELFRVAMPRAVDVGIVAAAGVAALAWMEGVKGVFRAT
jgi:Ca2+-transporting ATPase